MKRVHSMVSIMLTIAVFCGCSHPPAAPPQSILPGTGEIPLIVWQVYAFGDTDGDPWNLGSRLSIAEIRDSVYRLQQMAPMLFKANVKLTWDPDEPIVIPDAMLVPNQSRGREVNNWVLDIVLAGQAGPGFWIPGALNLYFVGDVQRNPVGGHYLALTIDPRKFLADYGSTQGIFFINDCGFQSEFGFEPLPVYPDYDLIPANVTRLNVAEHELTHFLARFNDRIFSNIHYTPSEHTPGMAEINVLRPFPTPDPFPLFLPGTWNAATSEQGEIWTRVYDGNWNQP